MSSKKITYSLPALKTLLASKNSCVYCIENCHRSLTVLPAKLGDLKNSVKEYLSSKITTCDPELQGIILSHKNIKVIDSVQLSDDGNYRLDYVADTYIFKPAVGSLLTGVVNKKSGDYLGVLVHSVFNATIPRPRVENECPRSWAGAHVQIGQQVTFQVTKVIFSSKLHFIKGKLVGVEDKYNEDGDSGIGGHESTEEGSSFRNVTDKPLDFNENLKKKKKKKKKTRLGLVEDSNLHSDHTAPHEGSSSNIMTGANLSDIEALLLNEVITNTSKLEEEEKVKSHSNGSGKKRKRDSFGLDSENSTLTSPLGHSSFAYEDETPKVKKKKRSKDPVEYSSERLNTEDNVKLKKKSKNHLNSELENTCSFNETTDLQSTIDSLLCIAAESLSSKKKKKKSSILNEGEVSICGEGRAEPAFEDSNVQEAVSEKRKKKKKHSEPLDETLSSDFYPNNEASSMFSEKKKKNKKYSEVGSETTELTYT